MLRKGFTKCQLRSYLLELWKLFLPTHNLPILNVICMFILCICHLAGLWCTRMGFVRQSFSETTTSWGAGSSQRTRWETLVAQNVVLLLYIHFSWWGRKETHNNTISIPTIKYGVSLPWSDGRKAVALSQIKCSHYKVWFLHVCFTQVSPYPGVMWVGGVHFFLAV